MTTPAALRDHISFLTNLRDASQNGGGVRSIDFGKASGDAFISALTAAIDALQLRTAASEGGEEMLPAGSQAAATVAHVIDQMIQHENEFGWIPEWIERLQKVVRCDDGDTHPPEVARDAERYRWLRSQCTDRLCVRALAESATHTHAFYQVTGKELDRVIDAAISGAAGVG